MKHIIITLLCLLAPVTNAVASDLFVNANLGVFHNFNDFYKQTLFDYGIKGGAHITTLEGFSEFWTALAINRNSSNPAGDLTMSNLEVMVQPLFMDVSGSHFFFGPQVGFNFLSMGVNTTAEFSYGLLFGWKLPVNEHWSISPEVNLTRFSNFGESQIAIKALVGANYTF
jgi:hypothetical protein